VRRIEGLIIQAEEDQDHDHEILLESEAPDLLGPSVVMLNATQNKVPRDWNHLYNHQRLYRVHE